MLLFPVKYRIRPSEIVFRLQIISLKINIRNPRQSVKSRAKNNILWGKKSISYRPQKFKNNTMYNLNKSLKLNYHK